MTPSENPEKRFRCGTPAAPQRSAPSPEPGGLECNPPSHSGVSYIKLVKEPSDESLVEAALEGDDEAFVMLVTRHKRQVIGLAARFTGIREDLDDICQDVFMKAYGHLRSYKRKAPFEHWLSRITVNTCYDYLRKKKKQGKPYTEYELTCDIADPSIEERRAAEEAYRILYSGLAKLRTPERLVITLLELEEKTVRDVADLTGWSMSNVKVRAFRARKALKKIIEDDSHE